MACSAYLVSFSGSLARPSLHSFPSQFRPATSLPFLISSKCHNLWARGTSSRLSLVRGRALIDASPLAAQKEESGDGSSGGGDNGSGGGGDGGNDGSATEFISSALMFALWAGFIGYAALWSPNQTPYGDQYFVEKLLGLRAGDGFEVNKLLVNVWYAMGIWPLIYTMLLIPGGRSPRGRPPVWPFAVVSFAAGAFALLPYFGLWRPPPPKIGRDEIRKWPLNLLESKLLSAAVTIGAVVLASNTIFLDSGTWLEYWQYFRGSRFIHIMSIDFVTLSLLAPFWVYNDMTVRQWVEKGLWLIPFSLVPVVGPAVYLLLRPSLPSPALEKTPPAET